MQSAGVGLNVLFADIIDEYVLVRLHHAAPLASLSHYPQVEESDLHDMPACDRPSALTASLTDDYVHIEVEPPEETLPETDLKRQQHLKLLRQQAAEELERKLLEADERLSALKSALPSPQQEQEEQKLRQVFESIIDQLQETFEGRQILEKPSIQKRLVPDLSVLDQHQRALMEQQRLLDALMVQVRHLINMYQVLFALEAQRLLLFHTFFRLMPNNKRTCTWSWSSSDLNSKFSMGK